MHLKNIFLIFVPTTFGTFCVGLVKFIAQDSVNCVKGTFVRTLEFNLSQRIKTQ